MSNDNGTNNFNKVFRSNSPVSTTNSETIWTPSIKATQSVPYSSVKKLNLIPKRSNDCLFSDSNLTFKRFKLNNDNENLINSHLKERVTSRFSLSTPSSASTSAQGFMSDLKYLPSFDRITDQDSPSYILNNNLPNVRNHNKNNSYFYSGKTTFGGANLRKNFRRLSATPYSKINVKCIEPNRSNSTTNLEDLPLSSLTQRILDRLDKAAIPIQDAKSRISTLINSKNFENKKFRLFDTTNPSAENNGRCNVDLSHKSTKYILKICNENEINKDANTDNNEICINKDIEKLNQIKKAEKELEQLATKKSLETHNLINDISSSSSRKITFRDVKKGRKIDDFPEDDKHLQVLANTQPLSISSALKPFSLTQVENEETNKKNMSDKNFDICDTNLIDTNENLFQFSSPKLVASLNSNVSPTIKINFSSPINVLAEENNKKSSSSSLLLNKTNTQENISKLNDTIKKETDWKIPLSNQLQHKQSNVGSYSTSEDNDTDIDKRVASQENNSNSQKGNEINKTFTFGAPNLPQPTTIQSTASIQLPKNYLFQKDINKKNWTCPTCSVSNDIDENACVSCEEPNPNKKPIQSEITSLPKFGFNSTSGISSSVDSAIKPQISLNELFKKDSKKWTCSICMVPNDPEETKCISCEGPNPNKPQIPIETKTSFGFKFGSFNNSNKNLTDDNKDGELKKSQPFDNGWQCFYCKAFNPDNNKNTCVECQKIKVIAATKNQVHKFYESQTFKFGSNDNILKKVSDDVIKSNNNENIKKEDLENSTSTDVQKIPETITNSNKATLINQITSNTELDSKLVPNANKIEFGKFESSLGSNTTSGIPIKPTVFKIDLLESNVSTSSDSKLISSITTTKSVSTNASTSVASKSTTSIVNTSISTNNDTPTVSNFSESSNQNSLFKDILNKSNISETDSTHKTAITTKENSSSSPQSNLFVFGSKSSSSLNKIQPFNFNTSNSNSTKVQNLFNFATSTTEEVKATSNVPTNTTASLFVFGNSSTLASTTSTISNSSTTSIFQFGNPSTVVSTTSPVSTSTTTSLFVFGNNPTVVSTTVSTSKTTPTTSTFGKSFNFGSPLSVPKIGLGPPVPQQQKININFPEPTTSNTTAPTSIFEFGSSDNNKSNSTEIKFNFGAPSNVTLSTNNNNSAFGSFPTNFNFMGNNNNNNNTPSSLFSFTAKTDKQPESQATTSFSFSNTPNNINLTFGAANPTSNNLFPPQSSQPQMPSFNSTTNQPFKFESESNLNFQSFPNSGENVFDNHEPGGLFQFSANPVQFGGANMGNDRRRTIKKARRRLGNARQQ